MARRYPTLGGFSLTVLQSASITAILVIVSLQATSLASVFTFVPSNAPQVISGAGCLLRVPEAITTVREEQRQIEAEREAFEAFAAEIKDLNAADNPGPATVVMNSRSLSGCSVALGDTTESVRTLYRETVMAVDHYEEEYNEPLLTNVAAELGADFRTALLTSGQLTTPLQQALSQRSYSVASEREEFNSFVQSELDSLTDAKTRLRNVTETIAEVRDRGFTHQPIDTFEASTRQLRTVEEKCELLMTDRQTEYTNALEADDLNFTEYLYQEYEWTHPVVGDTLDVIDHARDVKAQITTTVSDRL